ncbi:anthranilate synthase component I family protein [Photorhabdus laumondii]|uniref:anthranilate synthase component I family protein n=1 Tax=Photorhabdus laumondii TaxID=2218628 RepID=UPI001F4F0CF6|nr:anthranilate synthase component I family protein [Photorhabdus laumondii]
MHLFAGCSSAFWLDSELSDRSNSRYSVMGECDTSSSLKFSYNVNNKRLSMTGPNGPSQISGDVFLLMDEILRTFNFNMANETPFPFKAGVVGYLGYELKALTGSPNRHSSDMPDAVFYLPKNIVVFDHLTDESWACNLWGEPLIISDLMIEDVKIQPLEFTPGAVEEDALSLEDSSSIYIEKIKSCLKEISDGESYEICLTNRARLKFAGEPVQTYLKMRMISPVPYGAFFKDKSFSILSSSPETFLKIDKAGVIKSKPIKGTRPRGTTPDQDRLLKSDLANSPKDRAENLMIVDLVRHDLNSICILGSVKVPLSFDIEEYSSVYQLVSTVEGRLFSDISPFHAIKACFPGESMTGTPKLRTMELTDRLESSARGIYSGALGWIDLDGYTDLSIVIRTAVVRDGVAEFGIGGAIVAASDPVEEMEETLVKASVPFYSINSEKSHCHE